MEVKATEMSANAAEKVTRERLRAMRDGEEITVTCKDGYDMDSQKNTAYALGRIENCRFSCKSDGLKLTVTRGKSSVSCPLKPSDSAPLKHSTMPP